MQTETLQQPCAHLATQAESERDPSYTACAARPGEPCRWARRYDGERNPCFHSERLEWATEASAGQVAAEPVPNPDLNPDTFRDAVLASGLV